MVALVQSAPRATQALQDQRVLRVLRVRQALLAQLVEQAAPDRLALQEPQAALALPAQHPLQLARLVAPDQQAQLEPLVEQAALVRPGQRGQQEVLVRLVRLALKVRSTQRLAAHH